jgi:NADPH2:quinone reductase
MRAMRAEGFSGYKDLKLVDIPKPAVSDGRVLVKITAAGVTPLEHTILSGGYPRAKAPLVLGGEGAGVVEEGGGNGVSCRFTCDVCRAIWRFREWGLQ